MMYFLLFLASALLTYIIRSKAFLLGLIDTPGHRSSHTLPTPRGGGLAIIVTFFAALFYFHSEMDPSLFGGLCMAIPVALSGLIDDWKPLSAKVRLAIQFASAGGALFFLGGVQTLQFGLFELSGIWVNILALLIIVWLSNLYNFLDGLDGYAAAEGIFVSLGGFILFGYPELLFLAAAIAGFLLFNWHKASIFMGDVGSATLGFLFAVWMLYDAGTPHFNGWIILLSLFWFDATITLYRRWRNGEKLTEAHKKHLYQRLHQSGFSHSRVVLTGMAINLALFIALFYAPEDQYLLLLGFCLMILFGYLKYVDLKKGFE